LTQPSYAHKINNKHFAPTTVYTFHNQHTIINIEATILSCVIKDPLLPYIQTFQRLIFKGSTNPLYFSMTDNTIQIPDLISVTSYHIRFLKWVKLQSDFYQPCLLLYMPLTVVQIIF